MNLRRRYIWVVVNCLGVGMYLWAASGLWVLPGEEGMPGGPGDAFHWLFTVVPVLAMFGALNLAAFAGILRRAWRCGGARTEIGLWVLVMLAWGLAMVYDHARSVHHIDAQYASEASSLEFGRDV